MRKNIYNNDILMLSIDEIYWFNQFKEISDVDKLVQYRMQICYDLIPDNCKWNEIGILLNDDISKKIENFFGKYAKDNVIIKINDIHNAFLYAITNDNNREIRDILQYMLINRVDLAIDELKNQYGSEIVEYILSHRKYNYATGTDPIVETDKNILLFYDDKFIEIEPQKILINQDKEIFSNPEDCYQLARYLTKKMGNNIGFDGTTFKNVVSGKYISSYRDENGNFSYFEDGLSFYYKFNKDGFLRIGVGNSCKYKTSIGEKLAALSVFCENLQEKYGEPSVFYTLKEDEEEFLNLQWSFVNKEQDINDFKNGNYFDDATIDNLIIIGKENKLGNNRQNIADRIFGILIGLPSELVDLVLENSEDFGKYKTVKDINVSDNTFCDGVVAASYDVILKKVFSPKNK